MSARADRARMDTSTRPAVKAGWASWSSSSTKTVLVEDVVGVAVGAARPQAVPVGVGHERVQHRHSASG